MSTSLEILFEDNHCLAVAKPAGALMIGDETGDETLLDQAKEWLREKYNKPGNIFLGVVHRLDRPVSGVALYARTSKSASRLSDQFRRGSVEKFYNAWIDGSPPNGTHTLTDWLLKDRNTNTTSVVREGTPGAKFSTLEFRVVLRDARRSLVEIHPKTGRSHQIRVQFASRGFPILGDVKYGGAKCNNPQAIALHARSLIVQHPTQKIDIELVSELPVQWSQWFDVPV
ncbi:MAG: RNA pseudouridine synthase [Rhodopirellula sp.]|nr:RNA pseudouridine synthase [Rhodopirellula sp.]